MTARAHAAPASAPERTAPRGAPTRSAFSPAALLRPALHTVVYLGAAMTAAGFSFDFGLRAGGTVVGVIAAVNGAVFATILMDAASDAWRRRRRPG